MTQPASLHFPAACRNLLAPLLTEPDWHYDHHPRSRIEGPWQSFSDGYGSLYPVLPSDDLQPLERHGHTHAQVCLAVGSVGGRPFHADAVILNGDLQHIWL